MEIRDVCTLERYKDKEGQEKTSWYRIGTAFLHDDGRISVKLAATPVDGSMSLFPKKDKNNQLPY